MFTCQICKKTYKKGYDIMAVENGYMCVFCYNDEYPDRHMPLKIVEESAERYSHEKLIEDVADIILEDCCFEYHYFTTHNFAYAIASSTKSIYQINKLHQILKQAGFICGEITEYYSFTINIPGFNRKFNH